MVQSQFKFSGLIFQKPFQTMNQLRKYSGGYRLRLKLEFKKTLFSYSRSLAEENMINLQLCPRLARPEYPIQRGDQLLVS